MRNKTGRHRLKQTKTLIPLTVNSISYQSYNKYFNFTVNMYYYYKNDDPLSQQCTVFFFNNFKLTEIIMCRSPK